LVGLLLIHLQYIIDLLIMKKKLLYGIFLVFLTVQIACKKDDNSGEAATSTLDQQLIDALLSASNGKGVAHFELPASDDYANIPQDPGNPLSNAKVRLGQLLFHETALGTSPKLTIGKSTYSCASCHHAPGGFQACLKQGIGEGGVGFGSTGEGRSNDPGYPIDSLDIQPIRSPSAMNSAYQIAQLWNGQFGANGPNVGTASSWDAGTPKEANHLGFDGVEIQAIAGLKVHRMEIDTAFIFHSEYKALFDEVFAQVPENERYSRTTAGLAIAAYERTLLANLSPFQQWIKGGSNAMTDGEKEGAILFFSKAGCASCHNGPALNSMTFYALGMEDLKGNGVYGTNTNAALEAAQGRGGFTKRSEDMYKFKTPQLYNLASSPFYGHGGSMTTIREVVAYKNKAVPTKSEVPTTQLAAQFKPLHLTDIEIDKITLFLQKSLYDPALSRYEPNELPSGNCFPNNDPQSKTDRNCI
jgi:cytochrome c peroxidase